MPRPASVCSSLPRSNFFPALEEARSLLWNLYFVHGRWMIAAWVLGDDAPVNAFLQPGLLAIGGFAVSAITAWLAQRVAARLRAQFHHRNARRVVDE